MTKTTRRKSGGIYLKRGEKSILIAFVVFFIMTGGFKRVVFMLQGVYCESVANTQSYIGSTKLPNRL